MLSKCPNGCVCEKSLGLPWAFYDNPTTQCREYWLNGECEYGLPWAVIQVLPVLDATAEERDCDAVCPGKIRGSASAIDPGVLRESACLI